MSLLTRFNLILMIVLVGIGVVVGLTYRSAKARVEALVKDEIQKRTEFFQSAAKLQGKGLNSLVSSYSWWDDMVKFMAAPDPKWAELNIDSIVGMPNGCDALWVVTPDFETIHQSDIDYRMRSLPPEDRPALRQRVTDRFEFNYYTVIGDELWEIYGAAIQDPNFWRHETPVSGYLLIGKRWDETWVSRLGDLARARLKIIVPALPADAPVPNVDIQGYAFRTPITGIDGRAVATVEGVFDATIIERVRNSMGEQALIFALGVTLLVALLGLLIGMTIVRPLGQITRSLESRNPIHLADLMISKSDFGAIARLLSSQFRQGRMLQDEIRRRLADSRSGSEELIQHESNEALRLRLASDLHDGPLQSIYAAGLKISSIETMIQTGRTPNLSQLAGVREILKDCTANLRNLLLDLEPEEMRDQDLEESLRRFERYLQSISRQSADFRLEDGVLDGLDRDVQLQVYYIVRELLSNATRHAQPERTKLHIGRNSQYLTIHWENDGFTPVDEIKPGNGLHNIGHRVHQLDGTFNYGLHRRRTWRVTIELPFTALNGSLSLGEGGVNR